MVRIHPDPPTIRDAVWPAKALGESQRWGCSSVGRAPALQAGGHRFDPVQLHQIRKEASWKISSFSKLTGKPRGLPLIFDRTEKVRLFFNKTEEVKRTRRSIVVCWVRLYRPVPLEFRGTGIANTRNASTSSAQRYGIKRLSACGGCLGDHRR